MDGPTKPVSYAINNDQIWSLVGTLSRNYRALGTTSPSGTNNDNEDTASVLHLRRVLQILAQSVGRKSNSVSDGLINVEIKHTVTSTMIDGIRCVGRGLVAEVTLDQDVFAGDSTYLFSAVLTRYLSRQVSINSFIETIFLNKAGQQIGQWDSRQGCLSII